MKFRLNEIVLAFAQYHSGFLKPSCVSLVTQGVQTIYGFAGFVELCWVLCVFSFMFRDHVGTSCSHGTDRNKGDRTRLYVDI